jgi:hypothetical protein
VERSRLPLIPALVGLAAVLGAAPAAADEPSKDAAAAADEAEVEPDAGEKRPAAPDERTGHLYFGASGTAMGPAGAMGPATPSTSLAVVGFGAGGYIGVGLGRHATLQAIGDWTKLYSPGTCSGACGGETYSVGLGLTYHLAQGIAFDPWGSFGVAYRRTSFNAVAPSIYQGIDVARIAFGGDFYPVPQFGFGPYIEGDFGTNFRWAAPPQGLPPDVNNGPRTYALFSVGVRIAFDPMRKASRSPAARDARGVTSPGY